MCLRSVRPGSSSANPAPSCWATLSLTRRAAPGWPSCSAPQPNSTGFVFPLATRTQRAASSLLTVTKPASPPRQLQSSWSCSSPSPPSPTFGTTPPASPSSRAPPSQSTAPTPPPCRTSAPSASGRRGRWATSRSRSKLSTRMGVPVGGSRLCGHEEGLRGHGVRGRAGHCRAPARVEKPSMRINVCISLWYVWICCSGLL
mmetsp:Transcript_10178/g.33570  ORF Transcript_10178/g.33570 Transcript_10178/m.33570 type:complete len:201 (-) Transcript_10178:211-813(-)